MMFSFDIYGYLSDQPIPGRETAVAPPAADEWPSGKRPNWTGHAWIYLDWPAHPALSIRSRVVSVEEFRARFTDAEMAAVVMLAYAGAGDVTAALLLLKLQTSAEIDLSSPVVESGLAYLTEKMCLAPGRAEEILA